MAGRKSIQQEEHSLNSKITVLQEISYAIVHKKILVNFYTKY